jgi:hypothetical protein
LKKHMKVHYKQQANGAGERSAPSSDAGSGSSEDMTRSRESS